MIIVLRRLRPVTRVTVHEIRRNPIYQNSTRFRLLFEKSMSPPPCTVIADDDCVNFINFYVREPRYTNNSKMFYERPCIGHVNSQVLALFFSEL